jgi:hypothetical protein
LNQPKKARIAAFLKEFKKIVTAGRGLDIIPRHANVACLAELGLTRKNQREEIWPSLCPIIVKARNQTRIDPEKSGFLGKG